jgi:hypothetical protein
VDHSKWATPVVAVPKKDGKVRLCRGYKVNLNPVIDVDQYPLPRSEDLFATLAGGKYFSVLDLSDAYQQIPFAEESRQYMTIKTHRGFFSGYPPETMDINLQGIEAAANFIDDSIIQGKSKGGLCAQDDSCMASVSDTTTPAL